MRVLLLAFLLAACSRESVPPPVRHEPPPPVPAAGKTDDKLDRLIAGQDELNKKLDEALRRLEAIEKRQADATPGPRKRLDPETVYAVDPTGGALYGPKVAKVTMVEAFEFACPYCATLAPVLNEVVARRSDVRMVKLHFIVHPATATEAAWAYCAAEKQGRHADFELKILSDAFPTMVLGKAKMVELARALGLDVPRFERDMNSEGCKKLVAAQHEHLRQLGVSGTPTLFINGKYYQGARTPEAIGAAIDAAAAEVDKAVGKNGVTVENHYQREIVGKGKKTGP
jgi:protein-disulfide isomerase